MTQHSPQLASWSATTAIVTAVADADGIEPTALEPPLGTVIDTDALNTLLDSSTDTTVQFCYRGHKVVAHADGTIDVR